MRSSVGIVQSEMCSFATYAIQCACLVIAGLKKANLTSPSELHTVMKLIVALLQNSSHRVLYKEVFLKNSEV